MNAISEDLVIKVVTGAENYLSNHDELTLLDQATDHWAKINHSISKVRPSKSDIWEFLKDVSSSVALEIIDNHRLLATVTLVSVTRQLLEVLINSYQVSNLELYMLPIQLLAAVTFNKVLEKGGERLKK